MEHGASIHTEDSGQRYDFRYYDHASLLVTLSDGDWPGNEGDGKSHSQK
jgi:hypothetical protein